MEPPRFELGKELDELLDIVHKREKRRSGGELIKIMNEIIIEGRALKEAVRHADDRMNHLMDRIRDMRDKSEACSDSNR